MALIETLSNEKTWLSLNTVLLRRPWCHLILSLSSVSGSTGRHSYWLILDQLEDMFVIGSWLNGITYVSLNPLNQNLNILA